MASHDLLLLESHEPLALRTGRRSDAHAVRTWVHDWIRVRPKIKEELSSTCEQQGLTILCHNSIASCITKRSSS